MKHKLYNRLLSLALAVGLVAGMLPGVTFAGAVDSDATALQSQVEQIAEPTEEPETVSEESSQAEATPTPAPESSQVEETPAPSQEPEDDSSANTPQTVNFSDVAPFLPPVVGGESVQSQAMMMLANRVNTNQDNSESEDSGLELSKDLLKNDNGKYSIQLEAYATGEIKVDTDEKTVPTDIVLVLDQSGSMEDEMVVSSQEGYQKLNGSNNSSAWNNRDNLYYFDGTNYYKVTVSRERLGGIIFGYYRYTYSWYGQSATSERENGQIPNPLNGNLYRYTVTSTTTTRLAALKTAVTNFVNSVQAQAKEDDVNHRIAMVGFGSDYQQGDWQHSPTYYENSELIVTQNSYGVNYQHLNNNNYKQAFLNVNTDGNVNSRLTEAISRIDAEGGTAIDLGMEMAKNVLDNNPVPQGERRNRVVIVFTDGVPGIYEDDSDSERNTYANRAIGYSKNIKGAGTTVYTVGIFDGADAESGLPSNNYSSWNDPERANRFMHLLSSNYPSATNMATSGSSIDDELGYYLSAADADTLNDIFQKISDNIQTGGSSSSLDSSAVVRDVLTQELQLPEGTDQEDIAIQVYKANANTLTNPDAEGAWTRDSNAGVSASIGDDGRTIDVTGFDFSHNFVADKGRQENDVTQEGDFYGRKVVITIPVEPNPDFLGGNNVPTNTNASGIYANEDAANAEDPKAEEYFESPNINIPVNPTVNGVDKTIYLTTSTSIESIIENMYQPDGWNNSKVTITYEVKYSDGTVANTYTVQPGATSGSWANEKATLSPEDCEEYTITCKVTPNEGIPDSAENPAVTEKIVNDTATVHVLKPTVTWKDTTKDKDSAISAAVLNGENFVKVEWADENSDHTNIPAASSEKPELNYTFVLENNDSLPETLTAELHVKVNTVKANDQDITSETNFSWEENSNSSGCSSCQDPNSDGYQFRIHMHLTDITLTLQKDLTAFANNGKPVFSFKITNRDTNQVWYVHADLTEVNLEDGADWTSTITLPAGEYRVEEMSNQNYDLIEIWVDEDQVFPSQSRAAIFDGTDVELDKNMTIRFVNHPVNTDIPTDGSATKNTLKRNDDGLIVWKQDPEEYGNEHEDNINPDQE